MPMMDAQLLFCESMSIADDVGHHQHSTNVIDLGALLDFKGSSITPSRNISGKLYLNVVVEDTALLAAVDGSVVTMEVYHHTAADAVDSGAVLMTKAITCNTPTDHPDGTVIWCQAIPLDSTNRYLEMKFTIATQILSAGAVTAWIGPPVMQS